MAHIGVLKVLEDLKIPIDCIAGTSMGAIVGGLYASGMTAHADRRHHALARLAGGVSRRAAAPRPGLQAQARRPQFSGAPAARVEARTDPAAERLHSRAETAGDAAPADPAVQQQHGFRFAAHAVSRGGHRSRDRQCRADGQGRSRDRHARQHVGAGRVRAGGTERPAAGRRRTGGESAHQRGARDACGHSHRVRREFPAAAARRARFRAVDFQPDAGDSGAQGFRPPASQLGPAGYFDRARIWARRRRRISPPRRAIIAGGEAAATRGHGRARGVRRRRCSLSRLPGAARARASRGCRPSKFVRVDEQSKRYEKTIMAEMQPLLGKPLDLDQVGKRITDLYGLGNFETLDYSLVDQRRVARHEHGRGTGSGRRRRDRRWRRRGIRSRSAGAAQILGSQLSALRFESGGRFPGQQPLQRGGAFRGDRNQRAGARSF